MNPENTVQLSVVVCTYNRAPILMECLASLASQPAEGKSFEVIVVDNNSTDETHEWVSRFIFSKDNFKLVSETKQGLSHARNRGFREAMAEWVAYIDDDALACEDFVERILFIISTCDFDCFGGRYVPWYRDGKPYWFRDEYGSNRIDQSTLGILEKGHLSGGVMVMRKSALIEFNGFPPFLGMRGDTISYGEETYVQTLFRNAGKRIGYDPELVVRHLVPKHKMRVGWFLSSGFQRGKVSWQSVGKKPSAVNFFRLFKIMVYDAIYTVIPSTRKLLNGEFFIQNWFIEIFRPQAKNFGALCGALNMLIRKHYSQGPNTI